MGHIAIAGRSVDFPNEQWTVKGIDGSLVKFDGGDYVDLATGKARLCHNQHGAITLTGGWEIEIRSGRNRCGTYHRSQSRLDSTPTPFSWRQIWRDFRDALR